jgi:hypothetical protein
VAGLAPGMSALSRRELLKMLGLAGGVLLVPHRWWSIPTEPTIWTPPAESYFLTGTLRADISDVLLASLYFENNLLGLTPVGWPA